MNKQPLIDQILTSQPTPRQVLKYLRRSIITRNGLDVTKDWVWNSERLPYYELKDLQDIVDDLKQKESSE